MKFVYAFFPKEQYSREYTSVHKVLEQNPAAQRKLETLYRLCMKDLLSTERIYQLNLGLISDKPSNLRVRFAGIHCYACQPDASIELSHDKNRS